MITIITDSGSYDIIKEQFISIKDGILYLNSIDYDFVYKGNGLKVLNGIIISSIISIRFTGYYDFSTYTNKEELLKKLILEN